MIRLSDLTGSRDEIRTRAQRGLAEIDELFREVEHWNHLHRPLVPLDPDPNGTMANLRIELKNILRQMA